jgi:hypothetical protein
LRVISLRGVEATAHFIAIEPEPPFRTALVNDAGVARLDPASLPEDAQLTLKASPSSIVFADEPAAANLRATLVRAAPSFSAETSIEAFASGQSLRERYTISITPAASRINRLRVFFSQVRPDAFVWRLTDSPEATLTAQRVGGDEGEGETWDVVLDQPRDTAFSLTAERAWEGVMPAALAFASLPQANAQTGKLLVHTAPGVSIELETRGLKPIPPTLPRSGEYSTVYGSYRFEPTQQPYALLAQTKHTDGPGAWIWTCRLISEHLLAGRPRCVAVCDIENAGQPSLLISLPAGATLQRVRLRGHRDTCRPFVRRFLRAFGVRRCKSNSLVRRERLVGSGHWSRSFPSSTRPCSRANGKCARYRRWPSATCAVSPR